MVKSESQSVRNWIFSGLFHRQQYLPTSSIMLLPWHCAAPKFVLLPPKNVLSLMLSFLHWIWLVSDISLLIEWLPKSFIGILLKGFNIKPLLNNNWFSRVHRWWQNLYNLTVAKFYSRSQHMNTCHFTVYTWRGNSALLIQNYGFMDLLQD